MSATEIAPMSRVTVDPPETVAPEAPANGTPGRPAKTTRSAGRGAARRMPAPAARSTRVVLRTLDPWSVLKLSLLYYLALFVVILVAGALLWAGASAVGAVGNIESFMVDIGFDNFHFVPGQLFGGVALGGLVLVVTGTFANVLMAALFNLISDVVGGLKLTLQEDSAAAPAPDAGKSTV